MSADRYPFAPGDRGGDTDRAAAKVIAPVAPSYEAAAYRVIGVRPSTADEVHATLEREFGHGIPQYSVRPRLSALVAKGLAVDSGLRRPSAAGRCLARVYRQTTQEERALFLARREAARREGWR